MRFITIYGAEKSLRNSYRYNIKWSEPSRSFLQTEAKVFLYPFWKNHDVYEEFPIVGTRLSLDFYNNTEKIAVEVQGQQHTKFVPYFQKNKRAFLEQLKRDEIKEDFCNIINITLVTLFYDDEICKNLFKEFGVALV